MSIFLLISVPVLVLTGGLAWLIRISYGYPEHIVVGIFMWFLIGISATTSLIFGGFSKFSALLVVVVFSTAGYFFDDFLRYLFPDPSLKPPRD